MSTPLPPPVRRDVAARGTAWARAAAAAFARAGIRPNTISLASIVFAAAAAACLVLAGRLPDARAALLVAAALLIQCRLLCNLFDGMVAIEGGFRTKSGEVFNDRPDRIADPLILVAAGYAAPGIMYGSELGWLAGLGAVLTAYVRMLGGAAGGTQPFCGPMAKQHRMALITVALLLAAALPGLRGEQIIAGVLALIALGCAATVLRRARLIVRELEGR
jgi:phosphatidylglycerophosphate synthase